MSHFKLIVELMQASRHVVRIYGWDFGVGRREDCGKLVGAVGVLVDDC